MKAVICKSLDGIAGLEVGPWPDPEPGRGEVLVRVRAVALNFLDTLIIKGRYQEKPPLPFILGAEFSGFVEALGADVEGFRVGERVMGFAGWGACAELVSVPAARLTPVPVGLDDDIAAGLTVTYGTAMHGLLDRAELAPGETVAILGAAGGAGLAAVEVAKLLGARVIAVASSEEKRALARAHGADQCLGESESGQDLKAALKALTDGKGVDVVYDCVGGAASEAALRATAWGGRFLIVGFASGEVPRIALNLLLLKGAAMLGVYWGAFLERDPARHRANMERVLAWCRAGDLKPHIGARLPLERTAEALALIEGRKAQGKIVVTMED